MKDSAAACASGSSALEPAAVTVPETAADVLSLAAAVDAAVVEDPHPASMAAVRMHAVKLFLDTIILLYASLGT